MFHLAFPVKNLKDTIDFYTNLLGAKIGRSAKNWVDFDLYQNQITAHQDDTFKKKIPIFGKEGIPINHFGIILALKDWEKLKTQMINNKVHFLVKPHIVFEGKVGEQHTFFVEDPNGYSIEFKGFRELESVFLKNK